MGLGQSGTRRRRGIAGYTLRATALIALPCAAPGWSAAPPAPLVVLAKAKLFGLADARGIRAMPLRLKATPAMTDPAELGPEAALSPDGADVDTDLLTRFLAIRQDLRFLVNSGVKDVRYERITIGLQFARSF